MNFRTFLFLSFMAPTMLCAQSVKKKDLPGGKDNYKAAVKFYRGKTDLPGRFVVSYVRLISGLEGNKKKDSLRANKLIERLDNFRESVFYKLMRIRLQWAYQQRLLTTELNSLRSHPGNNTDSAYYFYTVACYYKDKLDSAASRKLGYVRAGADGVEYVDWKKMQWFNWNDSRQIEMISHHPLGEDRRPLFSGILIKLRDTCVSRFKEAMALAPEDFYYLQETLFFLARYSGQEQLQQQIIISRLNDFSGNKQAWLRRWLTPD